MLLAHIMEITYRKSSLNTSKFTEIYKENTLYFTIIHRNLVNENVLKCGILTAKLDILYLAIQAQLFDRLEDEDNASFGNDTFMPRRSIKKLVIKSGGNSSSLNSSLNHSVSLRDAMGAEDSPVAVVMASKYPDRSVCEKVNYK